MVEEAGPNWVDLVVVALVAAGAVRGLARGLMREAIAFAGLSVGLTLATQWHQEVARVLRPFIGGGSLVTALAYTLVVLGVLGAATLLTIVMLRMRRLFLLGWLDRLGGAAFGAGQGAILATLGLVLAVKYPTMGLDQAVKHSEFGPRLLAVLPTALAYLPRELESVADFFRLPKTP